MNKLHNNKGFSLIEIIITIAIMAIVTGATMSIYSWIRTQKIENLTEKISDSLNDARTASISKDGNYYLEIKKEGENYKAKLYKDSNIYKEYNLGKVGTIKVNPISGTASNISSNKFLKIRYNKSNGGVAEFKICDVSSGSEVDGNYKIVLQYDSLEKVIEVSKLTGKHFTE